MKRILTILILTLCTYFTAGASHIVGGDFSLQHISGHDYYLTMKVFRDCENGIPPFNTPAYVGMYEKHSNRRVNVVPMILLDNDTMVFVGDNCINIPTGCTHIGLYRVRITLDPQTFNSPHGYYFSWERCCRNTIIKNIVVGRAPGTTGATIYMEIPPLSTINSTPVFNKNPLTLLCTFNPFVFNYNVTDPDGDSLVYSLKSPVKGTTGKDNPNDPGSPTYPVLNSGPYDPVDWQRGYSLNGNIMDGAPDLTINRKTGELSVTPTQQGVYVVAIRVEEYRHGVKLGEVTRELQFTISSCMTNAAPALSDNIKDKLYILNATDKLCFDIEATDPDGDDSLKLTVEGDIFGGEKIPAPYATLPAVSGKGKIKTNFCWNTTCEQASADTHTVTVYVTDNGCPLAKTSIGRFRVVVQPPPLPAPPDVLCLDKPDENTLIINYDKTSKPEPYTVYYLLTREDPDGSRKVMDTILPGAIKNSFTDATAYNHPKNHYKYFLKGKNICNEYGEESYKVNSDPSIPEAPLPREIITATVIHNKAVKIEWEKATEDDFLGYLVYRRPNHADNAYQLYHTELDRDKTYFMDTTLNVEKETYCYRICVADKCGYKSLESNSGCNMVLQGKSKPFEHTVQWNKYYNWKQGVSEYQLYRRDPANGWTKVKQTLPDANTCLDDELNTQYGAYWYKVVAKESGGNNAISESNEIYLVQAPIIHTPNAFTPNGDNANNQWGIVPVFVKDYDLKVYNRWGERVYDCQDKNTQWDGCYRSADNPAVNSFIYMIMYTGWDNSTHYKKGNVTIIK